MAVLHALSGADWTRFVGTVGSGSLFSGECQMSADTKLLANHGTEPRWPGVLAAAIAIVNIVVFMAWTAAR